MKKFFKFGCLGIIGIVVLFVVIAIATGGNEETVSTGGTGNKSTESSKQESGTKKVDASEQTTDAVGLKIALGEMKVTKDKIQVGINVENTSSKTVSFYPDQGSAVVGDMQLDANLFLTDGQIGGDVNAGVKQDGVIEFLAPDGKSIDVENIQEVKLLLGDVTPDDFSTSKAVEFTVPVK
ncbi:hypothetical protein ABEP17_18240 [Priestia flexa]|jgi:hypothetical protein|uniref:hypothetical protein n=1 Tax=Priestia flexa TaxID=86664 RepID=UPI003D2960E3